MYCPHVHMEMAARYSYVGLRLNPLKWVLLLQWLSFGHADDDETLQVPSSLLPWPSMEPAECIGFRTDVND